MKPILFVLISVILFSCGGKAPESNSVIVGAVQDTYKIVDINTPKHFSVTIQNLRTGQVYENLCRRKWCSGYRGGPKRGDTVILTTIIHRDTIKKYDWNEPSTQDLLEMYCK